MGSKVTLQHVLVVVPARDEAGSVGACVRSIRVAGAVAGIESIDVVVVADSCRDDTARIARRAVGGQGMVIETDVGRAGAARAIGTTAGLARTTTPLHLLWTAHTDADSTVPPGWLAIHRLAAEAGAAAVAGVVEVDHFDDHGPHTARRHRLRYEGPTDDHAHVHGANLGVRADAYRTVGGWSAMATGEDHALWCAVRRAGYPVRSTRTSAVVTSGRRIGRAPAGFAAALRDLDAAG
ncbi:MAG: glycosyltransferase [Ilumatobacteraceae bacterium]